MKEVERNMVRYGYNELMSGYVDNRYRISINREIEMGIMREVVK